MQVKKDWKTASLTKTDVKKYWKSRSNRFCSGGRIDGYCTDETSAYIR